MTELPIDQIICGDAVELMKTLDAGSVHAIVTDPPYGLEFMGEEWDKFKPTSGILKRYARTFGSEEKFPETGLRDARRTRPSHGLSSGPRPGGKQLGTWWSLGGSIAYQEWTTSWAREALRVLKPGGSMLVMGGTRTHHRMACGVEDAGFTIKDCLMWCYMSGFPKAQDLGKMIDKRARAEREVVGKTNRHNSREFGRGAGDVDYGHYKGGIPDLTAPATDLAKKWDGWKVGGLKPAYEPIVWAVKPSEGSWTENVLKHGVGAVNVDACRIPFDGDKNSVREIKHVNREWGGLKNPFIGGSEQGRFPSNLILTDPVFDAECPEIVREKETPSERYSRFFIIPKAGRGERDEGLEGMPTGELKTHGEMKPDVSKHSHNTTGQRPAKARNIHPTCKPVRLMEHLIKLVTREGQIVLDPFVGSGTTAVACRKLNRHYLGFDNSSKYVEIARRRLASIHVPLEEFCKGAGP